MKASDYIVRFLEAQGVEYVFGYQGGMVTHLVDSLSRSKKIRFIPCYHEQQAGFAAEGYARVSGKIGVCIVTSGPGATNVLTSVGNAFFDSVPVLYITGQVNSYEYKYSRKIRQLGFQETDIVSMSRPVVKHSFFVDDCNSLRESLYHAVRLMISGRPGPVLIDIAMDVQRSEIDEAPPVAVLPERDKELASDELAEIRCLLLNARRPLLLCGGGLASASVNGVARDFIRRTGLPYVVSLMGKGLVDEQNPKCLGMIGSYGNRAANMCLSEADVVLVLGSRVDLRQTGNRKSPILSGITFVRVDVDENELEENPLPNQRCYHASVISLLNGLTEFGVKVDRQWLSRIEEISLTYKQEIDIDRYVENKVPYEAMGWIAELADKDSIFVADIGQNQMWAAQMVRCGQMQRFLTSGGMAPMGYAVAASVGAALATHGNKQVVCICGDGGFHMGVQALMMICQYKLPVTVVVFNNRSLGMITQFQRSYFNANFAGTTETGGYMVPDIGCLARAYGLAYNVGFKAMSVWEIDTHGMTTVVPKLEYDRGLNDMTPTFE